MTTIDLKVDAWPHIYNFGYRELWRRAEGERVEVPKDILIVY
jgi:hypothetical protein